MSNTIFVTHISNCIPESGLVNPIEIIYTQNPKSDVYFVRGMEGRPFSLEELNVQVANNELIELHEPVPINSDESLFLFEDGVVVKANSELGPFDDPSKIAVDLRLPCRPGLPITRIRQFGWLLEHGIKADEILASDLPLELDASLKELQESYVYLLEQNADLYFASFNYPEEIDNGLESIRQRIKAELGKHFGAKLRVHPKQTYDLVTQGYPTTPTFLLFPFFWRQGVKDFWGVLRYARQTKMGIVVSRYHPEYTNAIEGIYGPGSEVDKLTAVKSFLARGNKGCIYSFNSYIFDEVAVNLVRDLARENAEYAESVYSYQARSRPRPKSLDELIEKLNLLGKARGDNDDNTNSVLLVDPGESAELLRQLNDPKLSTLRYLTFRHEKSIPVGFGFSNSSLPMILRDGFWRHILNCIDDEFSKLPSEVIRNLADVGVELDARMLPKSYNKCEEKDCFFVGQYASNVSQQSASRMSIRG
jgi:hypothetical protein